MISGPSPVLQNERRQVPTRDAVLLSLPGSRSLNAPLLQPPTPAHPLPHAIATVIALVVENCGRAELFTTRVADARSLRPPRLQHIHALAIMTAHARPCVTATRHFLASRLQPQEPQLLLIHCFCNCRRQGSVRPFVPFPREDDVGRKLEGGCGRGVSRRG